VREAIARNPRQWLGGDGRLLGVRAAARCDRITAGVLRGNPYEGEDQPLPWDIADGLSGS
jgi:hypothetical protein